MTFKFLIFTVGVLLGILLCSFMRKESRGESKQQRLFHYAASCVYMGGAFLCASRYMLSAHYTEAVVVLAGLLFLAIYAIQDMLEMAVYAVLLYLGVFTVVFLKSLGYVIRFEFSALFILLISSLTVFVVLKVSAKLWPNIVGCGDYDILFVIYVLCGNTGFLQTLFLSSVTGLVIYIPKLLQGKLNKTDKIPLAPILCLGTLIYFGF